MKVTEYENTTAEIIETHDRNGNQTGNYRLVGIPGDHIDLPGKGGLITQKAARRAVETFENGGTHRDAEIAAWIY